MLPPLPRAIRRVERSKKSSPSPSEVIPDGFAEMLMLDGCFIVAHVLSMTSSPCCARLPLSSPMCRLCLVRCAAAGLTHECLLLWPSGHVAIVGAVLD